MTVKDMKKALEIGGPIRRMPEGDKKALAMKTIDSLKADDVLNMLLLL